MPESWPPSVLVATGEIRKSAPLSGGDINDVLHLQGENGDFVLKKNIRQFPGMFQAEARGLSLLGENGLPVPEVAACDEKFLLLRFISPGSPDAEAAGRYLALLHEKKISANFGLDHDNFIGSLIQSNDWSSDWPDFLWNRRFLPQLKLLNLSPADHGEWEKIIPKLKQLTAHCTTPSLLHGDLWSGNLIWGENSPCFIDPAVYFGDSLMELAFTRLFGAFPDRFYRSYAEIRPIPAEFTSLLPLYHIYPLLVHANLFGGGYYQSALTKLRVYV